jgi:hypothetical protein
MQSAQRRRAETNAQECAVHDNVHSRENLLGHVADHPHRQWMPKQVEPRQYVPETPDILIPIHLHSRGHKRKAMRTCLNSTGEMGLIKGRVLIHAHFVWLCVHRWARTTILSSVLKELSPVIPGGRHRQLPPHHTCKIDAVCNSDKQCQVTCVPCMHI